MPVLLLISAAWLLVMLLVVCLCVAARRADRQTLAQGATLARVPDLAVPTAGSLEARAQHQPRPCQEPAAQIGRAA
jgi:hypothetical protein